MIRPARRADLPFLAGVERSAATLFLGTPLAWAALASLPPALLREGCARGQLWVSTGRSERPHGFLLASTRENTLFVEELSVAYSWQRRGVGRRLLRTAIEAARRDGLATVTLTTDRFLPWNRPFYESAGFVVLGGADCPPFLAEQLAQEAAHGHDTTRRCAMRLDLRG